MHEKALNWACIPFISLVLNAKKNKDFNCNMPWWTWWNKSYYYYYYNCRLTKRKGKYNLTLFKSKSCPKCPELKFWYK